MTRVVIAEDEPLLRNQLKDLIAATWPEAEVVHVAENGLQAIRALDEQAPEVMFLDIHMPEASGIEVAHHANGRCHVVFVTAYDQYAVAAFEEGAVDYVMKPLSLARIATAVKRVKDRLQSAPQNLSGLLTHLKEAPVRKGVYLRWIRASKGAEDVQLITSDEIKYFQSDTKYTRVVGTKREGFIRKSIKELIDQLDPSTFWQIHRSTIVNLNAIESVGRDMNGHVILRLKDRTETLQVSQPFAHLFRQM
jgi:DNA-binding LytR/AlgR family response regulator